MEIRFTDVDIINTRPAINDYIFCELVSLDQAIKPLVYLVDKIDVHVATAKHATGNISSTDELTHDEAATVYLYSMETGSRSLYLMLNTALRVNISSKLKPWFLYLKLLHTALNKLPSQQMKVWRGLRHDVHENYRKGMHIIWTSVSSCSKDVDIVQKHFNERMNSTLLSIDCINGKSIMKYSAFASEQEIILMPGTQVKVIDNSLKYNRFHLVHLKELSNPNIQRKYTVLPEIKNPSVPTTPPIQQKSKYFHREYLYIKDLILYSSSSENSLMSSLSNINRI